MVMPLWGGSGVSSSGTHQTVDITAHDAGLTCLCSPRAGDARRGHPHSRRRPTPVGMRFVAEPGPPPRTLARWGGSTNGGGERQDPRVSRRDRARSRSSRFATAGCRRPARVTDPAVRDRDRRRSTIGTTVCCRTRRASSTTCTAASAGSPPASPPTPPGARAQ
jgi:hypothetical protein